MSEVEPLKTEGLNWKPLTLITIAISSVVTAYHYIPRFKQGLLERPIERQLAYDTCVEVCQLNTEAIIEALKGNNLFKDDYMGYLKMKRLFEQGCIDDCNERIPP